MRGNNILMEVEFSDLRFYFIFFVLRDKLR